MTCLHQRNQSRVVAAVDSHVTDQLCVSTVPTAVLMAVLDRIHRARARDRDGAAGRTTEPAAEVGAADGDEPEAGDAPTVPSPTPVPGVIPAPPQLRIIRPAVPAPIPADDDDEHFVPPVPPPLPRLDPITKGAWVALFGGPAYLLIAVMVDWQVPGWAAFCAVAAFIGGFATLVVHMGERPPRDSGPDDGAVV